MKDKLTLKLEESFRIVESRFRFSNDINENVQRCLKEEKGEEPTLNPAVDFGGEAAQAEKFTIEIEYSADDEGAIKAAQLGKMPRYNKKALTPEEYKWHITQRPTELLGSNAKLKKAGIYNWTLPAFKGLVVIGDELKPFKTCPGAGTCAGFCYASKGGYIFSGSMVAHTRKLQYVLDELESWKNQMVAEIKRKNVKILRWHDSGDFFGEEYTKAAFDVMRATPEVDHYAYTKMLGLMDKLEKEIPENFYLINSEGGLEDALLSKQTPSGRDRVVAKINKNQSIAKSAPKGLKNLNTKLPDMPPEDEWNVDASTDDFKAYDLAKRAKLAKKGGSVNLKAHE